LHERAGVALESMFAGQLDDHLEELARHYSRTDNVRKAIEYLRRAGEQAIQRTAKRCKTSLPLWNFSGACRRTRSGTDEN
jgi:Cdc6-like AAA superfamily ATPase